MKAVIWGVLAVVLAVGNFILDLMAHGSTAAIPRVFVAGSAGYALASFLLAAICLLFKKYRNAGSFFKAAAFWAGLMLIGNIGQIGTKLSQSGHTSTKLTQQQVVEKAFIEGVEELNAKAPFMVDEISRLDKAVAGPGARATYFFSFLDYSSHDFDRDEFIATMKHEVSQESCSDKNVKFTLQYGGIYVFSYAGNDGVEIARFELSKNDCDY